MPILKVLDWITTLIFINNLTHAEDNNSEKTVSIPENKRQHLVEHFEFAAFCFLGVGSFIGIFVFYRIINRSELNFEP